MIKNPTCPECHKPVHHGATRHRQCQGTHIGRITRRRWQAKKTIKFIPILRSETMKAWLKEVEA
jgi:hypothetical protein